MVLLHRPAAGAASRRTCVAFFAWNLHVRLEQKGKTVGLPEVLSGPVTVPEVSEQSCVACVWQVAPIADEASEQQFTDLVRSLLRIDSLNPCQAGSSGGRILALGLLGGGCSMGCSGPTEI